MGSFSFTEMAIVSSQLTRNLASHSLNIFIYFGSGAIPSYARAFSWLCAQGFLLACSGD